MKSSTIAVSVTAILASLTPFQPTFAQQATVPSPEVAVRRACDAAGGLAAFNRLGLLRIDLNRAEITQDGTQSERAWRIFVGSPGPLPGRVEYPDIDVVAGDDGSGGWALQGSKPDARPSTSFMVQRLLATDLFPIFLPFSLTWPGVATTAVVPAVIGNQPTWRLTVQLPTGFFHTPQIATTWTIDIDRDNYQLVRAESPYTDLGRGIKADGMRFHFSKPTKVAGTTLWSEHRVTGIDALGSEKSHSRIDELSFAFVPEKERDALFANPIPVDQRPGAGRNFRPPKEILDSPPGS